ncbi:hypothetical protein DKP76_07890 [Falsochrobactrum shanghaiense]|uniref:YjiS-like domain-containing protein n=1 Tax=Falsochrobactrum shanghaiense TaxID=2201899 RepID=A0A316J744_9HYPH|nr:DUF1127 domain-containing protein [Falsochrobactrum shanghaiense]PWL17687.1 hypothetical protein DKP76_07890 [Falsochrobactrum shanghaiense]
MQRDLSLVHTASPLHSVTDRLKGAGVFVAQSYKAWAHRRRVAGSLRILEALPEHILHDIGWPNIDDRLAGPERKRKG